MNLESKSHLACKTSTLSPEPWCSVQEGPLTNTDQANHNKVQMWNVPNKNVTHCTFLDLCYSMDFLVCGVVTQVDGYTPCMQVTRISVPGFGYVLPMNPNETTTHILKCHAAFFFFYTLFAWIMILNEQLIWLVVPLLEAWVWILYKSDFYLCDLLFISKPVN